MFSLAFLKPMYKVLSAESCSGGDTQQPVTASAEANQNPPSKSLVSSFSKSFISSGKQGGGATVLGEGHDLLQDLVNKRNLCSYFSEHKQLRKSSCTASCTPL
jgi:hypothetical protein